MEEWKKIGKALLFPPMVIPILLVPVSAALLVYALAFSEEQHSVLAYASYVVSAYTLTVWCVRIPRIIRFCKSFKQENRYARRWLEDPHLRVKMSLYASFLWNAAYAGLQLYLAMKNWDSRFWYWSLAVYYLSLTSMRFFLGKYIRRNTPGEQRRAELLRYRACGWVFLVMNLALSGMIILMIRQNQVADHGEIVTIAMAAYTFVTFTAAIVSIIKYRRYNSPVFSASKAISLAAACVSMLTLEATMLTTFSGGTGDAESLPESTRILFMALTGAAVVAFIVAMAIYMIVQGTRRLKKELATDEERTEQQ